MESTKSDRLLTEDAMKKLKELIKEKFKKDEEERKVLIKKYPPDPPNEVCNNAFLKGISIENSFKPSVKDFIPFFTINDEKIFIWTYKKDTNSALISQVNSSVKEKNFWKNVGNILALAFTYSDFFEKVFDDYYIEYKWIYYFNPITTTLEGTEFYNMNLSDAQNLKDGRIVKATEISEMANVIELLARDDREYTSLALLNSSINLSYCCLTCELGDHPYHDHLIGEPEIWNQASILPQMEAATVQACRCVEGILGEPPSNRDAGKVFKFKTKVNKMLEINFDDMFSKANKTYLEFYYELFFSLRNPSAHNYGNVHFDLERKKVIEAQCFATIIMDKYFDKNLIDNEIAMDKLNFNMELLNRVVENLSTSLTV